MNQTTTNGRTRVPNKKVLFDNPPKLLHHFDDKSLREFLDIGEVQRFRIGDKIMEEGELATSACLIARGIISIWKEDIHITNLGVGDFIGEAFMFGKSRRIANVFAEEDVVLMRFSRKAVLEFFQAHPERLFKIFVMNIIAIQQQKISRMDQKIVQIQKQIMSNQPGEST